MRRVVGAVLKETVAVEHEPVPPSSPSRSADPELPIPFPLRLPSRPHDIEPRLA
jgi:hypothetical protein